MFWRKNILVQIFCGDGHGKTSAALGSAVRKASEGKSVIIIQFLKGKAGEIEFLNRLEPEIKIFRFEKNDGMFESLTEEQKQEEIINMKNGLNFARKVLSTRESDIVILDEVLGLVDMKAIDVSDILNVIEAKADDAEVILTGRVLDPEIAKVADVICEMNER
ncbi:MAG: cob(I)yrinic acid a,c-diamide adenosyltransferase [Lachnospiraceae bacterium]|nr:cob(I)yrinic acid a,c-diamide adenosyltransferase [Lachnospiraceae bacterium]